MFLLVPAYPGCPGSKAVKRSLLLLLLSANSPENLWRRKGRLQSDIMQGTMPGARRRGRPRTAWMDNIKTWTGLSVINGESTSMVWLTLGSMTAKEQKNTVSTVGRICGKGRFKPGMKE